MEEETSPKPKYEIFKPQKQLQGMKVLDRSAFRITVNVPQICLPIENLNSQLKKLKKHVLKIKNFTPIKDMGNKRQIFLNPNSIDEIQNTLCETKLTEISWTEIDLTYENWTHDAIFKSILPPDLGEGVSGFSTIGHILHLNLRESYQDYKHIIGEVFLDKIRHIQTVVNKRKAIESVYRNFEMEVLAGEPNFEVTVKENGVKYEFDFSKVFWNPRLATEHGNLTSTFGRNDIVFDVFAGVGPFAIPSAKIGCTVYANDLNPDSYKWLCRNIELNKVSKNATAYNLDGSAFIRSVVKEKLSEIFGDASGDKKIHVLMNLPGSALEFVPTFESLIKYRPAYSNVCLPKVYVYFFVKSNDKSCNDVIEEYLPEEVRKNITGVSTVRDVSTNKQMHRVTFTLPKTFLFEMEQAETNNEACPEKKQRLDS